MKRLVVFVSVCALVLVWLALASGGGLAASPGAASPSAASAPAGSPAAPSSSGGRAKAAWTYAMYLNADNDLAYYWKQFTLPDLRALPANPDVNIVAMVDYRLPKKGVKLVEDLRPQRAGGGLLARQGLRLEPDLRLVPQAGQHPLSRPASRRHRLGPRLWLARLLLGRHIWRRPHHDAQAARGHHRGRRAHRHPLVRRVQHGRRRSGLRHRAHRPREVRGRLRGGDRPGRHTLRQRPGAAAERPQPHSPSKWPPTRSRVGSGTTGRCAARTGAACRLSTSPG